jgi:S1-C subfamily serine protease
LPSAGISGSLWEMTGRHVRETLFAAFLGLLAGIAFHFVTGTERAAGQAVDPLPRPVLEDRLSRSVMRADVMACGVHRQGTVTLLDMTAAAAVQSSPDSVVGGSEAGPSHALVTNAHVVQGAEVATLSGARLGVHEGSVDAFVENRDAATLALPPEVAADSAGLEPAPMPNEGDRVLLAGFPEGRWTVRDARVESIELRSGWGDTSEVIVLDAPVEQGISGGVVVDLRGRAVGLIAARDPGTAHAVAYPIEDLLAYGPGAVPGC